MASIDEIRKERLEKVGRLEEAGVDPYPARTDRTHSIRKVLNRFRLFSFLRRRVVLSGRIRLMREHGSLTFLNIEDGTGSIQILLREDGVGEDRYSFFLDNFDVGDFIEVKGRLTRTKTGERTLEANRYRILTKSLRPLPEKFHGLKNKEERYRRRYLDLVMNPEVREVFEKRSRILTLLRNYLDEHGFMEFETPVLQPVYGGASAKPFVTRLDALDMEVYLRISDELYLKRLIAGGFDKVYEVSKDFRNEGIDKQHNPEFTQIEFYWAYADYGDLMRFTERMLTSVIKKVCGGLEIEFQGERLDFSRRWRRVTYREVLLEYTGIDIDEVKDEEGLRREVGEKLPGFNPGDKVGYGPILDDLYKEYARPHITQPTFLVDHPVELMPLAKRKTDDPSKIESFQLLVSGYEVIKAYSELNNPLDQEARWLEQEGLAEKGLEEYEVLDRDYIEALEYGIPPTAGWGMGIDRLTAILTDQPSIRDVITFPFMRPRDEQ